MRRVIGSTPLLVLYIHRQFSAVANIIQFFNNDKISAGWINRFESDIINISIKWFMMSYILL